MGNWIAFNETLWFYLPKSAYIAVSTSGKSIRDFLLHTYMWIGNSYTLRPFLEAADPVAQTLWPEDGCGAGFPGFSLSSLPSCREPNLSPFYSLLSLAQPLTRNESFTLSGPLLSHPLLRKFGDDSLSSSPFSPDSLWSWWHRNTEAQLSGGSRGSPRWPVAFPGLMCFSKQEYDFRVTRWSLFLEVSVSPPLLGPFFFWRSHLIEYDLQSDEALFTFFLLSPSHCQFTRTLRAFVEADLTFLVQRRLFWALAEERLTDPFFFLFLHGMLLKFAYHPSTGALLISVSFQF